MAGEEAKAAQKRMASYLASKLVCQYSEMCGYVQAQMALAIVRCNALLLRGPQDGDSHLRRPAMEDGVGMVLQTRGKQ
eukprot:10639360-Ditylum_brightwellii.AAC.1